MTFIEFLEPHIWISKACLFPLLSRLQKEVHEAQLQVKKEMLGEIEAAKHEAELQITTQKTKYEKEIKNLQDQLVRNLKK